MKQHSMLDTVSVFASSPLVTSSRSTSMSLATTFAMLSSTYRRTRGCSDLCAVVVPTLAHTPNTALVVETAAATAIAGAVGVVQAWSIPSDAPKFQADKCIKRPQSWSGPPD